MNLNDSTVILIWPLAKKYNEHVSLSNGTLPYIYIWNAAMAVLVFKNKESKPSCRGYLDARWFVKTMDS